MSDTRNTIVKCLARSAALNWEEWLRMIEARRTIFCSTVAKWRTLPSIGDQEGLHSEHHPMPIDGHPRLGPKITYKFYELLQATAHQDTGETQGIFHCIEGKSPRKMCNISWFPDFAPEYLGTLRYWALMRSGAWAIVTVTYVTDSGYKGRGKDYALEVKIQCCTIAELLQETQINPRSIWWRLTQAFAEAINAARRRAVVAEELARRVAAEDEMLTAIPDMKPEHNSEGMRPFVPELDNPGWEDKA
jgi:hypothetical protein